jgi:hypothetical protein
MQQPSANLVSDTTKGSAQLRELIELAIKMGTESGWFGDNGREEAFRKQALAKLTAIEQDIRGDLGPAWTELEEVLRDLVLRRQVRESRDECNPGSWPAEVTRDFDWRRAAAVLLGSALAGTVLHGFRGASGWTVWVGLGAVCGLVILGPWRIVNWICAAGARLDRELHSFQQWLVDCRRNRQLGKQIAQLEEKIPKARQRRFEHDQWVDQHLAELMSHFDLQRRRAEQAVKIAGQCNAAENKKEQEATYAQILQNDRNHDERH